jgi:hypothetical protein
MYEMVGAASGMTGEAAVMLIELYVGTPKFRTCTLYVPGAVIVAGKLNVMDVPSDETCVGFTDVSAPGPVNATMSVELKLDPYNVTFVTVPTVMVLGDTKVIFGVEEEDEQP